MLDGLLRNQAFMADTMTNVTPAKPAAGSAAGGSGGARVASGIADGGGLTHLKQLEAESIHIIREVAAEFANPVMLYSIGKDSSVMVRLAQKAFHPARLPFPLLHIDTT